MATKTITIEIGPYDALVRARLHPRESFSDVIRRATWDDKQHTAHALLTFLEHRSRTGEVLDEAAIQTLARQDAHDVQISGKAPRHA